MERPTALIRRLLIVEALQESMAREMARIKEKMRADQLRIIDRRDNVQDIRIQYIQGTQHEEAIFMRKMLDAASKNRAQRTGMIP